jgi:hypothetical protein
MTPAEANDFCATKIWELPLSDLRETLDPDLRDKVGSASGEPGHGKAEISPDGMRLLTWLAPVHLFRRRRHRAGNLRLLIA